MKKTSFFAAAVAAAALSVSIAQADEHGKVKCVAVDANGNNIVKEGKADCASGGHSCAGHNKAHEADAWVLASEADCEKNKSGNFEGVAKDVLEKIEH